MNDLRAEFISQSVFRLRENTPRIGKCLDDAAAAGMTPGERATYSRSCAQQ